MTLDGAISSDANEQSEALWLRSFLLSAWLIVAVVLVVFIRTFSSKNLFRAINYAVVFLMCDKTNNEFSDCLIIILS